MRALQYVGVVFMEGVVFTHHVHSLVYPQSPALEDMNVMAEDRKRSFTDGHVASQRVRTCVRARMRAS